MQSELPALCPCGSALSFSRCCEPYISNQQTPGTPEQLMRSRYTAYCLKNEKYILASWHRSTRPTALDLADDTTRWKKLKIISSRENKVEFVAFYANANSHKKEIFALYEMSYFTKDPGWLYLHGEEMQTFAVSKNMLCPCRSGKKFKRCCGAVL